VQVGQQQGEAVLQAHHTTQSVALGAATGASMRSSRLCVGVSRIGQISAFAVGKFAALVL
jgi:hypothetical protein